MAAPPVLVGEDVAPAAVPEPDDDVVVMPAADELADEEPEAELDTLEDDPSQQHALESNPTLSLNDGASVNLFAQGAGVSRLGSPSRRSSSRRSGRLNVRTRSRRTMRSTGYAESQSESPNRFGSDAARDDSTVFDHDDSGSPVRNQRQEDHNHSQTATTTGQSTLEPVTETEEPRSSVDIKESTNLTQKEDAASNLDLGPDLRSDFTGHYDPNFLRQRPQPVLNPSIIPPPPAYSRDPLPGAEYFAKSHRQYDLVADLHRKLDDEARDDGDQTPPVVPESADTDPDYTFQSQNLAEEVI
ncbi:hypothetical protein D6C93_06807 [Aureobasidium pullulans]|nr:hypothetical protein D6C93_06807 [Aureobasidium pullulans]